VAATNTAISAQKSLVQNVNLTAIEKELTTLSLQKLRHEPQIASQCLAYSNLLAEKKKLTKEKDDAKTALDSHADAMIAKYEASINKLLKEFNAGFTITNSAGFPR